MKHPRLLVLVLSAVCLVALGGLASAQTDQYKEKGVYEIIDWDLTPAEFPCLAETIRVNGTFGYSLHIVISPSGSYSWQYKEGWGGPQGLTVVGLTTGAEYQVSGPLTSVENGWIDAPSDTWYPLEWTFHNVAHFVGPAGVQNFYLRQRTHITFDRETGELKVVKEIVDALCR